MVPSSASKETMSELFWTMERNRSWLYSKFSCAAPGRGGSSLRRFIRVSPTARLSLVWRGAQGYLERCNNDHEGSEETKSLICTRGCARDNSCAGRSSRVLYFGAGFPGNLRRTGQNRGGLSCNVTIRTPNSILAFN